MRLQAVVLPDLGAGPTAPIVVSGWYVSRGERVWEGDRLVEILAGAVTLDVPAPTDGRVARIVAREDDVVGPGSILGYLAVSGPDPDPRAGGGDGADRAAGRGRP
jgi:pyruvate/2-oxoglutarate dehydrogenase complex dihydrolipoamide acyltransferase (E2) component